MKYPRLPKNLDRRCKLLEDDIKKIKKLTKENELTIKEIAEAYNVSTTLIKYWTDKKFRKQRLEEARKIRKDYTKEKDRMCSYNSRAYVYKVNPKLYKFMRWCLKNKNK